MTVAVKRVYEAASSSDGVRVLVDRLWPRGLKKEDAALKFWLREVAPSDELRKWFHENPEEWRMFRKRYLKELVSEEASAAVEKLHHLAEGKRQVTLLFAARLVAGGFGKRKDSKTVLSSQCSVLRRTGYILSPRLKVDS